MKVSELIEKLKRYDDNMEVYDSTGCEVENVRLTTWSHSNYPYNKPDKQIVVIE